MRLRVKGDLIKLVLYNGLEILVGVLTWDQFLAWSKKFSPTCEVILKNIEVGTTSSQRVEADLVHQVMTSFEFVFILHLMKETMQINGHLYQELQSKSQDILNVMHLVSSTKAYIQQHRNDKWNDLLTNVKLFARNAT